MPEMENQRIPECGVKSQLMNDYSRAITEFSRCAQVVNTRMGVMYKGDYERLSWAMSEARVASENAHRALIVHISDHGC